MLGNKTTLTHAPIVADMSVAAHQGKLSNAQKIVRAAVAFCAIGCIDEGQDTSHPANTRTIVLYNEETSPLAPFILQMQSREKAKVHLAQPFNFSEHRLTEPSY
jgi:hypothetical protein